GDGSETNFPAALAADGQRSSELPSRGNLEGGSVVNLVRLPAFGIEKHLVPADDRHLVGGGGTGRESALESCRRKKVEFGIDLGHACGHLHVDGEAVEQVTPPVQRLPT